MIVLSYSDWTWEDKGYEVRSMDDTTRTQQLDRPSSAIVLRISYKFHFDNIFTNLSAENRDWHEDNSK
jgi:hypothetical protein